MSTQYAATVEIRVFSRNSTASPFGAAQHEFTEESEVVARADGLVKAYNAELNWPQSVAVWGRRVDVIEPNAQKTLDGYYQRVLSVALRTLQMSSTNIGALEFGALPRLKFAGYIERIYFGQRLDDAWMPVAVPEHQDKLCTVTIGNWRTVEVEDDGR